MRLRRGGFPLAMLVGALVVLAHPFAATAGENLKMNIDNTSDQTLYFDIQVGADDWPPTIAPGDTAEIKATHSGGGGDGEITYVTKSVTERCKAVLGFGWEANSASGKCDNKTFDTSNTTGNCTLTFTGCGSSSDCNCHFTFAVPGD